MPQMMPLNWMMLMLYFILLILFMNSILYFNMNCTLKNFFNQKSLKKQNSWKW
uniref:ATP synthase F0 subunit 8 n=1 Tax=Orthotrichia sp. XG-2021 TaxID=2996738 RepID=A0A9E8RT77_9NEOP|nr:ATP synthase F0 subunit 8 [Orthotrichia sp. XG-2021]